jgi:hypothetical protein
VSNQEYLQHIPSDVMAVALSRRADHVRDLLGRVELASKSVNSVPVNGSVNDPIWIMQRQQVMQAQEDLNRQIAEAESLSGAELVKRYHPVWVSDMQAQADQPPPAKRHDQVWAEQFMHDYNRRRLEPAERIVTNVHVDNFAQLVVPSGAK